MTRPQKHVPEYLSFTRKERRGIITIAVLIGLFIILPFLFPFFIASKEVDHSAFEKEIAGLKLKQPDSSRKYAKRNYDDENGMPYYQPSEKNYYSKKPTGALFYFDPNTLAVSGWVKLGVREKTANTIHNYISKGGRFKQPGDIARIWGLHEDEVKRLLPYVRIEARPNADFSTYKTPEPYKSYEKPKSKIASVDINAADTSAFIALPGIGSKLANRIISFREKLGGFYKVEQVAETFALPDSTFQKIRSSLVMSSNEVKKLNVNTATVDELKIHPYLRYNIANAIVQYRAAHGIFSALSDLKKIMIVTDEIYSKVSPYLTTR
ncbi:MAG: helix-hairpin-helix domain-containing protein [Ferruginibacter sp.]